MAWNGTSYQLIEFPYRNGLILIEFELDKEKLDSVSTFPYRNGLILIESLYIYIAYCPEWFPYRNGLILMFCCH